MDCDNLIRKVSYLRARDPSILSFNRPEPSHVTTNLIEKFGKETQRPYKDQKRNIDVYLRIKNGNNLQDLYEIEENTLTSKIPPGSNFLRNVKDGDYMKRMHTFTKIFTPDSSQRDIFEHIIKSKILDFINGQNSTIMTYGASGSGKTFTVIGTDEEPGIVPRFLEYLFRTLPQLSRKPIAKPSPTGEEVTLLSEAACKCEKQLCRSLLSASSSSTDKTHHVKTYQVMQQGLSTEPFAELEVDPSVEIGVWVSYAEVYNEQIYDLLQFHPPRGLQRPKLHLGMSKGHAYIKGLTNISVTSGEEAYQILQYGIHNLNYGTSRSHSIFTIKLVQVSKSDGGSYVSSFNFCDLTGSEKSRKNQNVCERLKESNNINSSLLVLGRCIAAVRNIQKQKDQKLVPFRESKLTQLFQRALTGFEDLAMIVNISHSREMFDETQHVLNFAAIAKDVILEQKAEPIFKKKNRFSHLVEKTSDNSSYNTESVEDLRYALRHMQEELENQRNEYKVTNQESIGHVIACYHRFFEQTEEETKKRIKKAENRVRIMYEAKLDIMIAKYEGIIEELAEGKNDVIEIISSDEEDQEQLWKHEKQNYERENIQLRNTLAEGIEDYKVLHEKYTQLLKENALLRGKCLELENEIDLGLEVKQEITEAECSDSSEKNFNYNESVIN